MDRQDIEAGLIIASAAVCAVWGLPVMCAWLWGL